MIDRAELMEAAKVMRDRAPLEEPFLIHLRGGTVVLADLLETPAGVLHRLELIERDLP